MSGFGPPQNLFEEAVWGGYLLEGIESHCHSVIWRIVRAMEAQYRDFPLFVGAYRVVSTVTDNLHAFSILNSTSRRHD